MRVSWIENLSYAIAVHLKEANKCLCVVCAHLPHSGRHDDEFLAANAELQELADRLRANGTAILLGVDANAQLGSF
eukprot:1233282-Amphidinium_carterae.1